MMKRIILMLLAVSVLVCIAACGRKENKKESTGGGNMNYPFEILDTKNPITAVMEVKDYGTITLELYPDIAPVSVSNFVYLAKKGFYDGLIFHRVISGFMIQGGDPKGDGTGGPGYTIKGEFSANGVKNTIKHERGVISMARSQSFDSAGSQFFIMHDAASYLDGQYAAFGKVTSGLDVVDKIAAVQTGANDKPVTDVVIKSIKIK